MLGYRVLIALQYYVVIGPRNCELDHVTVFFTYLSYLTSSPYPVTHHARSSSLAQFLTATTSLQSVNSIWIPLLPSRVPSLSQSPAFPSFSKSYPSTHNSPKLFPRTGLPKSVFSSRIHLSPGNGIFRPTSAYIRCQANKTISFASRGRPPCLASRYWGTVAEPVGTQKYSGS